MTPHMEISDLTQFSAESGVSGDLPGTHSMDGIKSAVGRFWSATTSFLSKSSKAVQVARMASVLNSMPDARLAQLGITSRSQIWAHAEKLVL